MKKLGMSVGDIYYQTAEKMPLESYRVYQLILSQILNSTFTDSAYWLIRGNNE